MQFSYLCILLHLESETRQGKFLGICSQFSFLVLSCYYNDIVLGFLTSQENVSTEQQNKTDIISIKVNDNICIQSKFWKMLYYLS